ncbi:AraC family transcriptional regulator [Streptomyces sp. 8K308]|uniref:helix-turn-helix transcriptional regulator n=1 Tax=Streptomyces sp. 8K308 TaxID=2530388 RepID=UPI001FB80C68|nr:AraC family transcriptional regulator [Streptomyces sp. 8K308]
MRATSDGFELEYTKPLSQETVDALAASYRVTQWRYVPTAHYGGPRVDEETLTVRSAAVSPDGRTVTLDIPGLKPGHVVHVRSPPVHRRQRPGAVEHRGVVHPQPDSGAAESEPSAYEAEEARLDGGAHLADDGAGRGERRATASGDGEQGATVRQLGLADSGLSHVARAVRWIREHYAQPFRVEDVARMSGMSVSAFYRDFQAVTAIPVASRVPPPSLLVPLGRSPHPAHRHPQPGLGRRHSSN